jgi:hypothetical protein
MKTSVCMLAVVAGLAAASQAAVINLSLIKTIDTSSTSSATNSNFVGSNVSGIAWNGTDLWVGGYNASGATANTAIAKYDGTSNSWGASFGAISTANSRGITGLAIKGNNLAAGWDNGAGSVNSVRSFNATTGTQSWATGGGTPDATRRAMGGVAFDPGFNGAGTNIGVSYLAPGSGRRHLMDANTGNYINGQNAGGIINFAAASTTWRGHAFDPATGDLYTRESNRVGKAVRTGDNTFATQTVIVANTTTSVIDNENIAFVNSSAYGSFLIFNDRSSTASGQLASNVIKASDLSGALHTLNFGSFSFLNGNGAYSFSFDAASQTLAISDFANRSVYIFAVPTPGTAALLGLGGLVVARRRRA